ncbi:hypothetical protein C7379_12813 [Hallella colorans]|uniref:Uncharacterized protein n=1 Tax=Hallella colorans TaxID=1703337 RepID=A0A2U0TX60_9BACT|nr:hypothetical protein C7379_12813 [Hallella colorans]
MEFFSQVPKRSAIKEFPSPTEKLNFSTPKRKFFKHVL